MEEHVSAAIFISEDYKSLIITAGEHLKDYDTGSLLIDLLELDYESFSMKYLELCAIVGTNTIIDTNSFDIEAEERDYNNLKKCFAEVAHFCFDNEMEEKYKLIVKGNIQQRYSYYTYVINRDFEESLNTNLVLDTSCMPYKNGAPIGMKDLNERIIEGTEKDSAEYILSTQPRFVEVYHFNTLADIMYFELINVIKGNIVLKRCENCNRYFVPTGRNDAKYCNRIAPGSEKTCVDIGAIKKYEKETENNPIRKAYRMEYKKRYARRLKGKMSESDFCTWAETMKAARDEALKGNLSYKDFTDKLED